MAVKTPLKWVGSKARLMPQLLPHLPEGKRLIEPFAGSCAVMMNTDYDEYLIADVNPDLVNLYKTMAYHTDALLVELEALFSAGALGDEENRAIFYYAVRDAFNQPGKSFGSEPGADEESDDELRERCRNQFNLVGNYHTDAVYRSMIAGVAGLSIDRIFFEHEAPRGPGTANAYLLLDSGVASAPFVNAVNDYINTQGHHGHGDDMQCYAMPETRHDLVVTVYVRNLANLTDDERNSLKAGIENMIRCSKS